jgi:Bifunctional DNA primase/polymerase, N-terminal
VARQPLDAAGEYLALGLPVIPLCSPDHAGMWTAHLERCKSPGKAPVLKLWTQRGLPTEEELAQWQERLPNANLGLILGKASGLVAVDVDGETGHRLLAEWSAGDLPPTWEFRSGRGRQLLYAIPEGLTLVKAEEAAAPGNGDHEELALLGQGQQTVIPPSVHRNGRRYQWEPGHSPKDLPAAMAPAWIVERMRRSLPEEKPAVASASPSASRRLSTGDYSDELLARAVEKAAGEGRNNAGIWLACQLRDAGLEQGDAWAAMQAYTAAVTDLKGEPYAEEEARHSLDQAFSRPPRAPWRATVLKVSSKRQQSIPLPSIAPMTILRTRPPLYTITVEGKTVRCSLEELLKWPLIKIRIFQELGFVPHLPVRIDGDGKRYPTQTVWEMILNEAAEELEEEAPAPEDASDEGMVWDAVCAFLTSEILGERRQDIATGSVFLDPESNRYLFRSRELRRYLHLHGANALDGNRLWLLLRDHGAQDDRLWINDARVRVWSLPANRVVERQPEAATVGPPEVALPAAPGAAGSATGPDPDS